MWYKLYYFGIILTSKTPMRNFPFCVFVVVVLFFVFKWGHLKTDVSRSLINTMRTCYNMSPKTYSSLVLVCPFMLVCTLLVPGVRNHRLVSSTYSPSPQICFVSTTITVIIATYLISFYTCLYWLGTFYKCLYWLGSESLTAASSSILHCN